MTEAIWLLIGILIGYAGCYFARGERISASTRRDGDEREVMVKRSKPSLRSPLKTHQVQYEKYRARDSGLYAPTVAKTKKDEVEIGR